MWNYYKIQDQMEIIADVKQQLSSPPSSSPRVSTTTANESSQNTNSEKGTQADRSPSAVSKKLF